MRIALLFRCSLAAALACAALAGGALAQGAPQRRADQTASIDAVRHERRLVAACGAEWAAMKRKGDPGAEQTWRRFWETCRAR